MEQGKSRYVEKYLTINSKFLGGGCLFFNGVDMARHSNGCIEIIICTLLKTKEHLNRTSIPLNPISEFHDVNRQ